jgi:predicted nucleic acid-binding protein
MHDSARQIAAKYGYSMYDGLIAAAALQAECDVLYSEEMHDGPLLEGRLAIRNPFR